MPLPGICLAHDQGRPTMRAAAKCEQATQRRQAGMLSAIGLAFALLVAVLPQQAPAQSVGVNTRFDYVATFPLGTTPAQIEVWRGRVLGQPHKQACMGGRACIARMMRLALAGSATREVIGFDLMPDTPTLERAAISAAAIAYLPGTAVFVGTRPVDLDANHGFVQSPTTWGN